MWLGLHCECSVTVAYIIAKFSVFSLFSGLFLLDQFGISLYGVNLSTRRLNLSSA